MVPLLSTFFSHLHWGSQNRKWVGFNCSDFGSTIFAKAACFLFTDLERLSNHYQRYCKVRQRIYQSLAWDWFQAPYFSIRISRELLDIRWLWLLGSVDYSITSFHIFATPTKLHQKSTRVCIITFMPNGHLWKSLPWLMWQSWEMILVSDWLPDWEYWPVISGWQHI
jgi:hypothetical protein